MKALVLAAGYATRLYPLTKNYPKPLLKVSGKHIIDYIIEKLDSLKEVEEILVVTNTKFMPYFARWKKTLRLKKKLTLIDDLTESLSDRRGAIGDMSFVVNREGIRDSLLVVGGDNLFSAGLAGFLTFVKGHRLSPAIGVYDFKDKLEAKKYGVVKLNHQNRVVDFQEKPKAPKSSLVAMCLYYFPKEKLGLINEYLSRKANKHDATGFYIDWLRKKVPVYGFIFTGRWYDIGDHKFYHQAQERFTV